MSSSLISTQAPASLKSLLNEWKPIVITGGIGALAATVFTPLSIVNGAFFTIVSAYYGTSLSSIAVDRYFSETLPKVARLGLALIGGLSLGIIVTSLIGISVPLKAAIVLTASPFALKFAQGFFCSKSTFQIRVR